MINFLLPAMVFLPIFAGLLPVFEKNEKRINAVLVAITVFELLCCAYLFANSEKFRGVAVSISWFAGMGISFEINGLGALQAFATSLIWVGSSVFSDEYFLHDMTNLRRYYGFFAVTFGATLGLFLGRDLFTVYLFFEVMSFASYALVAHEQNDDSKAAGNSYLTIAVLGGLVVLMGVFIIYNMTGTLVISELVSACAPFRDSPMLAAAGFMVFFGFAAKAGMFPLHGWLPQAHPAAPAPASTALSGILIKCGVYGVIIVTERIFRGNEKWAMLMLVLGVLTMFVGAVFALISVNLKQTLAYSSMSQIGFIIIGVAMTSLLGEEGSIAAYGAVLHMLNHTMIKLVLFTSAGIVYQNTHSLNLNEIKGFGRDKTFLKVCFAVAALGIMGIPGFNGYISKTLLHEGIVEYIHLNHDTASFFRLVEAIFLVSGGFTIGYMTKLYVCLFVKKPDKPMHARQKPYVRARTELVLGVVSAFIVIFGCFPQRTLVKIASKCARFMTVEPMEHAVRFFAFANIKGALISISIGALIYIALVRNVLYTKSKGYIYPYNKNLTIENIIYKNVLFSILPFIGAFFARIMDVLTDVFVFVVNRLFCKSANVPDTFLYGKPETRLDRDKRDKSISITDTLSYNLLLFGIGLVAMMIYLLFAEFRV